MKVLIIEDELPLAESIAGYLKQEGFLCETAHNFQLAEDKITSNSYDCVVVDLGLPDGNGFDLIRLMKANALQEGILILSARNSLDDKILGLGIGADDYLTKPFHLSELNARIKSICRRRNFSGASDLRFHEIRVNTDEKQAYVNDQLLVLTRKEYDLLLFFITNKNRVVTKESIVEHLWGDEITLADSYEFVYTHIKNLRKKILDKKGSDYIKTIYGLGYKFSDQ